MLKLYIHESNMLSEAIADVRKYYPNIDDDMFMRLINLDPTYRGNDSVGKYGKWLLNLYNKGNLSEDEFDEIPNILNQFTTYRNRIQNKDLNSYKSLEALADILATVIDDDSMLTNRQKVRFLKNVKSGKVKVSAEDDYDIVLDTPKFVVYVPNTHEASMKLGKGTAWCTAHENSDWYDKYTKDGGKLYIVKDKKTGERWQYSNSTEDFLDEYDDEFNIIELMEQDEKLSKFFKKFLSVDYYNFDGTWIYNGKEIPEQLKPDIAEIIIDNNVTEIGEFAFSDCENLTSINIPNSITKIGEFAFSDCENLTSINIPNSITKIGMGAFRDCKSLISISIPNSVTEIERSVFRNCSSLTSINIPNSITEIGKFAFYHCYKLTSINIPNSVTKIEDLAFSYCDNLTSINIPNSVIEIKTGAFKYCKNLTSINIPNSVTEIEFSVFSNCNNLTVYTNNKYVIDYCNENNVPVKPLNNNESINKNKRYKLHIKETYELKESNKPNVFNNNSRETYGDLINPNSKVGNVTTHDYYKFEKGKDAILTYMTADDYIDKCINNVFKSNYTKTVTNAVDWDKVNEYAGLMKQGTKFPTPYLDYVNSGQEGRHRALAFKQAFGEDAEMPVIELYPSNPTLDEIYDYCTQKWRNGEHWIEYVAPNFGYTTKEIYDYLGKEYIEPVEDEEQDEEEDIIDDTDVDFEISDEDILDDEYEMEAFEEFVREQSDGKIQNISDLDVDEFMKWMTKFTRYYS